MAVKAGHVPYGESESELFITRAKWSDVAAGVVSGASLYMGFLYVVRILFEHNGELFIPGFPATAVPHLLAVAIFLVVALKWRLYGLTGLLTHQLVYGWVPVMLYFGMAPP